MVAWKLLVPPTAFPVLQPASWMRELSLHLCQVQGQHDYNKSTLVLSLMRCIAADGEDGVQNAGEHDCRQHTC